MVVLGGLAVSYERGTPVHKDPSTTRQGPGSRIRDAGSRFPMSPLAMGTTVQGSRCRVQGAGCRVQVAGCREQGAGCRAQGLGCRSRGSGSQNCEAVPRKAGVQGA